MKAAESLTVHSVTVGDGMFGLVILRLVVEASLSKK